MKPILFNTDMVRAILAGRKTVTRRVVRPQESDWEFCGMENDPYMTQIDRNGEEYPSKETGLWATFEWGAEFSLVKAPYQPGQILYVRETWNYGYCDKTDFESRYNETFFDELTPRSMNDSSIFPRYFYRTEDFDGIVGMKWRPSIHMPREAARIFLRVTDVRAERLQDITPEQLRAEGIELFVTPLECKSMMNRFGAVCNYERKRKDFSVLWDSTIKKADRAIYSWEANPFVWVIEFERCGKPEGD